MDIFEEITSDVLERLKDVEAGATIRLSSNGGDVFAAIAAFNLLKDKGVVIEIVGLAASAASIIACAGKTIRMASNAAIKMHNPAAGLNGFYTRAELERQAAALTAAEASIIRCYMTRLSAEKARELLDRESWIAAEEAKTLGLTDEIIAPVNDVTTSIRGEERRRLRELQSLKGQGATADALIETAMVEGLTVAQMRPLLSAIRKVGAGELTALIADQMTSGAAGVKGASTSEERAAQMQRVIDKANAMR